MKFPYLIIVLSPSNLSIIITIKPPCYLFISDIKFLVESNNSAS